MGKLERLQGQVARITSGGGGSHADLTRVTASQHHAPESGESATHTHAGGGQAFPVGAVYLSVTGVNPATELGYGTWNQIAQGRVLVGQNGADTDFDTAEETGGAKTKTLAITELPSHTHTQQRHATSTGALSGITTAPDTSSSNPQTLGPITGATGGGQAFSLMNPYFVVYIWKRTA